MGLCRFGTNYPWDMKEWKKYNCRHFIETPFGCLLHQAGDVIVVANNVDEVPEQSLQVALPSAVFLVRFVLQRSMAIKTEQNSSVKTIIL